jgi:hypothetical protein
MTRISALLVAGLALAAGLGPAAARSTTTAKPVLRLVQRTPLKIQGTRFKARERVRLTAVTPGDRAVVTARSTRLGRIVATFGNFAAPLCKRLSITAVGARGDRATLEVNPPPALPVPCPS